MLDHYSYKKVYGTLVVMQIILAFTYKFSSLNRTTYAVWIWLSVWCEGGHFTLVPNIFKIIFGKHATALYGIGFSYTGLNSIILLSLLTT